LLVDIDCCIFQNASKGAMYLDTMGAAGTIRNTKFISNTVIHQYLGTVHRAGALTLIEGEIDVVNCTFLNNSASYQAGSIKVLRISTTSSQFIGNIVEPGTYPRSRENTVFVISPAKNITLMGIENTTMKCPRNEIMSYEIIPDFKYFRMICMKCDSITYNTIKRAQLSWGKPPDFHYEKKCKMLPVPLPSLLYRRHKEQR